MKIKELESLLEKVIKRVVRQELQRELTEVKLITSALREYYLKESTQLAQNNTISKQSSNGLTETQKNNIRQQVMPERFTPESVGGNQVLAQLLNETAALDESNYETPNPDFAGVDMNNDLMSKMLDPNRNKAILERSKEMKGTQGNLFE